VLFSRLTDGMPVLRKLSRRAGRSETMVIPRRHYCCSNRCEDSVSAEDVLQRERRGGWRSAFGIRHSALGIWHPALGIRGARHPAFGIRHSALGARVLVVDGSWRRDADPSVGPTTK